MARERFGRLSRPPAPSFAMKGGLKAEQWLYLKRGGQVAKNVMVIRKFGIPVARLTETITRG